jgi:hypothetical protein
MTEQEKAANGSKEWHPIVRLIIENPISALNTAAILFGGGFVYSSNENRMTQMSDRIAKIELAADRETIIAATKEDRAAQKVEGIAKELNDVKVTLRGVEASVSYIADVLRQQNRRGQQ